MGADRDGTFKALHVEIIADLGAYLMLLTPMIPSLGAFVMAGCYRWDAVRTDITGVLTNKMAHGRDPRRRPAGGDPLHRGDGRPAGRRSSASTGSSCGGATSSRRRTSRTRRPSGMDVRLGQLPGHARAAARALRPRAGARRDAGRQAARRRLLDLDGDLRPGAVARHRPGRLRRPGGADGVGARARARHRRGDRLHRHLAARPGARDDASRRSSPTSSASTPTASTSCTATRRRARGASDTYGSRSLAVGGEAIARASDKVVDKVRAIVAHKLEAAPEDIELRDGKFSVKGSPGPGHDAGRGRRPGLHPGGRPAARAWRRGSRRRRSTTRSNFVFPFGAHAAVVEVDPETGKVDVVRYLAVDDCGPAINPMLIDGQIHGGIAHAHRPGAVRADRLRRERPARDGLVRLLRAARAPRRCRCFETDRTETPSPVNSLGVKGVGEAGHDRRERRGHQRGDRRAAARRRRLHQHAAHAHAGVGGAAGEGRCAGMIPAEFDYVAPESLDDGARGAARGRRGRQGARRRPLAGAADEAAPRGADAARRPAPRAGADRHPARERHRPGRGDDRPPRRWPPRRSSGSRPAAAATIADQQVRNRGHDRRLAGPRRPGLRPARGAAGARGLRRRRAGRAASARSRPPTCSRTTSRRRSATARSSPRSGSRPPTAGAPATRSSTGAWRTGRWSRSAPRCARAPDGSCEDVRSG